MFDQEKTVFEELNKRLRADDIELSMICVGGFVLSHYGMMLGSKGHFEDAQPSV